MLCYMSPIVKIQRENASTCRNLQLAQPEKPPMLGEDALWSGGGIITFLGCFVRSWGQIIQGEGEYWEKVTREKVSKEGPSNVMGGFF